MDKLDWSPLKFLESPTNVKAVMKDLLGRSPSATVARDTAVCLQQGRFFFESAVNASLEIRPLLVFYGMMGFAKALIAARNLCGLETISQSHGLRDKSGQRSKLVDLQVLIEGHGTFQSFNDTISRLHRNRVYVNSMPKYKAASTCNSCSLDEKTITLKEILTRIPALESLYENTFQEQAKCIWCSIDFMAESQGYTVMRLDYPKSFEDRISLIRMIEDLRGRFSFLKRWCLVEAELAWDRSILQFANIDETTLDEFGSEFLIEEEPNVYSTSKSSQTSHIKILKLDDVLPPLAQPPGGAEYVIAPFDGLHISTLTLYYLGMFLLSSLVRYRPRIWSRALSRFVSPQDPADDEAMALIEAFLELSLSEFPRAIAEFLFLKETAENRFHQTESETTFPVRKKWRRIPPSPVG
jgi:hypothetical protein